MGRTARSLRHPSTRLSATVALVKIEGLDLDVLGIFILEPRGGLNHPQDRAAGKVFSVRLHWRVLGATGRTRKGVSKGVSS